MRLEKLKVKTKQEEKQHLSQVKQLPVQRCYLLTGPSILDGSNGPFPIPHTANNFLQQAHSEEENLFRKLKKKGKRH